MKTITLLGASGSIGRQTIDVMKKNPNDFSLVGFSVGHRTRCISSILNTFKDVKYICIQDKKKISYYQSKYPNITFYSGDDGLLSLIENSDAQMVVNALVGFVGLAPSIKTLELNKKLALANKESLVVGGELINNLLSEGKGELYPIDSEHVALDKCLHVDAEDVDKLILTASGGAFRNLSRDELENVTKDDALKHPTWHMGAKITIDCATMINKCFEIIEAFYLFNYPVDKIDVLLHDESHIHSMVKYKDGTYRADISKPDMRVPIKYALYERQVVYQTYIDTDYHNFGDYHFHDFDINRYPIVKHAKTVITKQGTFGAVLNAANEVAVNAFLHDEIKFLDIEKIVDELMSKHQNCEHPDLAKLKQIDEKTRQNASILLNTYRRNK